MSTLDSKNINQWIFNSSNQLEALSERHATIQAFVKKYIKLPRQIIHVTGTNAKGTCSNLLNNLLVNTGKQVGLFTSPHMKIVNERILINNQQISDEQMLMAKDMIENEIEMELSFFEKLFVIALISFDSSNLEYWIIEAGIGARNDVTNIFTDQTSILTYSQLDHANYFQTCIDVVNDKKYTMRSNNKCYSFESNRVNQNIMKIHAKAIGSKLIFTKQKHEYLKGKSLAWNMNYEAINLVANIAGDLAISKEQFLVTLEQFNIKYRLEQQENYIFDMSHNYDGIKYTIGKILEKYDKNDLMIFYASSLDKDYQKSIAYLTTTFEQIHVDEFSYQRTWDISKVNIPHNAKIVDNKKIYYQPSDKIKVILGSVYYVSEIEALIKEKLWK